MKRSKANSIGLIGALLLLSGCSLACAYRVATAADAVPSPLQADTKFPQLSREISSTRLWAPDLGDYVEDTRSNCTVFAPSNEAINYTMTAFGEYVGLFLQNRTMQEQLLNYHVIPGRQLKADQLGTSVKMAPTRANETLVFIRYNNRPYVSFGRKYVVPLEIVNIPAGGCIIHIINASVLAPPSIVPMLEGWLKSAGNEAALQAPENLWLPKASPLPGRLPEAPGVQITNVELTDNSTIENKTAGAGSGGGGKATSGSRLGRTNAVLTAVIGLFAAAVVTAL